MQHSRATKIACVDGKLGCSALYNYVPGLLRQNLHTFCRLLFFFFGLRQHKNCSLSCLLRTAVCSSCCHEHLQAFVCFCSEHSSTALLVTLCSFLKQSLHCLQLEATILHFQAQACCMIPAYSLHRSAAIGKLHSCLKSRCKPRLHRALLAPRILHTCRHAAAGKTWVCIQHHRLFLPISLQVDLASAASALLHVCSML